MKNRWLAFGVVLTCGVGGASMASCSSSTPDPGSGDAGLIDSGATHDGGAAADGGAKSTDAGADAASHDGSTADCKTTAWPAMLAAPITPLATAANLDLNHAGPATVPLAYAEQINCPMTALDIGANTGGAIGAWGPANDVWFQYDQASPNLLYELHMTKGYTGTLAFRSRAGGAWGDHQYVVGMNQLLRDGAPFVIDWTGSSADVVATPAITAASELFDAIMATLAPTYPTETDCYAAKDCIIVPDDLGAEANDGGVSSAVIGFRPIKTYIQMAVGSSTPDDVYMILTGGPALTDPPPVDAGKVPGIDAGATVVAPAGCAYSGKALWGTCESPSAPLCTGDASAPFACRDYPQSGYAAICCPLDGG